MKVVPSSSTDGGNTKPHPTKQISPSKRWCFTFNNYEPSDVSSIISTFSQMCEVAIIGKEVGEQGTRHLQGYCEFKKKLRPKNMFNNKIHWEKAKGSRTDNYAYCSKGDDIAYCLGFPKPVQVIEALYPWQKKLENLIKSEPDDRTVYWCWEPNGNIGKSAFIKYCFVKYAVAFCCGGKYADIINLIFNTDMDKCRCVMFDIPRCHIGAKISYTAIESIKNGLVFNSKYETGAKAFNSPHVFVFANEPPEEELLSNDRWHIIRLI